MVVHCVSASGYGCTQKTLGGCSYSPGDAYPEISTLAVSVWGRERYPSVAEAPHNTESTRVIEEESSISGVTDNSVLTQ